MRWPNTEFQVGIEERSNTGIAIQPRVLVSVPPILELHAARATNAFRLSTPRFCRRGRTESFLARPLLQLSHKDCVVGNVPPSFLAV